MSVKSKYSSVSWWSIADWKHTIEPLKETLPDLNRRTPMSNKTLRLKSQIISKINDNESISMMEEAVLLSQLIDARIERKILSNLKLKFLQLDT